MKPFLIQTIDGEVKHDFSFHLEEAVRYQHWYQNKEIYKIIRSDIPNIEDCIPVGSLEFVFSYIKNFEGINNRNVTPINIPKELFSQEFLKRNCEIQFKSEIVLASEKFIKSATQYKSFTDIISKTDLLPDDLYLVSDVVDIEAEYRIFVYNNRIVGIHYYAGDFTKFPDVSLVEKMVKTFQTSPSAYTLDVGVNQTGTFIIEVHPFVSCGLYGFRDYRVLPQMFQSGYNYMIMRSRA